MIPPALAADLDEVARGRTTSSVQRLELVVAGDEPPRGRKARPEGEPHGREVVSVADRAGLVELHRVMVRDPTKFGLRVAHFLRFGDALADRANQSFPCQPVPDHTGDLVSTGAHRRQITQSRPRRVVDSQSGREVGQELERFRRGEGPLLDAPLTERIDDRSNGRTG